MRTRAACCGFALGVVLALGVPAGAQFDLLPCDLAQQQTINGEQDARIRAFVDEWTERLRSEDIQVSVEGRNTLLKPLDCDRVSVAFRVAMGRALQADLTELARGEDERLAFDACRIAGRVASSETLRPLSDALRDERRSVRAGAAGGYRDMLETVAAGNNAVGQGAVGRALSGLYDALREEEDPVVTELMVHALGGTAQDITLHLEAMTRMCEAMEAQGRRIRSETEAPWAHWDHAMHAAADSAYQSMLQLQIRKSPRGDFPKWAGRFSGQIYVYALKRFTEADEGFTGSDEAKGLLELVRGADALLEISHGWISPQTADKVGRVAPAFEEALANEDPDSFAAAIGPLTGRTGLLVQQAYGATPSDFR